jgi:hypothetical protein
LDGWTDVARNPKSPGTASWFGAARPEEVLVVFELAA